MERGLLLQLVLLEALFVVEFGFARAVRVDRLLCEVVRAAAGYD